MPKDKKSLLGFILLRFFVVELMLAFFVLIFVGKTLKIPFSKKLNASILFYDDGKTELGRFSMHPKSQNALYFKEHIRRELTQLFSEVDKKGNLKIQKENGEKWDIYADGLKVYTSVNKEMQKHAELAMQTHLSILQPQFHKQLVGLKNYPYSNDLSNKTASMLLWRAMVNSNRYLEMEEKGYSFEEMKEAFSIPTKMRVFSWRGEIDTIMTPRDSILYYKSFLRGGLISIEPQTGFIKTWVGGADIRHFQYDHVDQARRQSGSSAKPFLYATALAMGVVEPCDQFSGSYCVGNWCPGGKAAGRFGDGLIFNSEGTSNHTIAILSKMGSKAGPINFAKYLRDLGIQIPDVQITPPMILGTFDVSLLEMTGAYASFVNEGIFNSPMSIYRIEDKLGNIIYEANPKSKEVLNQNVAYTILSILERGVNSGTSKRLRSDKPYGQILFPMAGKPGTTQGNSDGWFFGMTPDLVTGVWVGGEERSIRFGWTGLGQGASTALPIYGYFMNGVYADTSLHISKGNFKRPPNFDKAWPNCAEGLLKDSLKDGEYYYYTEPEVSNSDNPFL